MFKKVLIIISIVIFFALGGGYFYANWEAKRQADLLISQALESGAYEKLSYESISVNLISGELTLKNLRIVDLQQTEFILRQLIVSDYDYQHEVPHHLSLQLSGLGLPRGLPPTTTNNAALELYLNSLTENQTLPVNVEYSYIFDETDNNHIASKIDISLDNAVSINFELSVKNVPLNSLMGSQNLSAEQAQQALIPLLLNAEIPQASISIQDLGMVDAIIAIQAEENGLTEEVVRQQLTLTVQSLYIFAPAGTQALVRDVSTELASVLEGNKTVRFSIEPKFEGKIQSLQPQIIGALFTADYMAIYEMLNLKTSVD